MLAFMHHEYDVLVATTIIENGLDIPFGEHDSDQSCRSSWVVGALPVARACRALQSPRIFVPVDPAGQGTDGYCAAQTGPLKEFSDCSALDFIEIGGAGPRRGAGNMLGGEQSGHIEAVGFELYTTMLEQAVRELKGEDQAERPAVQLNLGISLRIDSSYIEEENQRLRMYKRIAGAENETVIEDIAAEMQDRYGPMPDPVQLLITAGRPAVLCRTDGRCPDGPQRPDGQHTLHRDR